MSESTRPRVLLCVTGCVQARVTPQLVSSMLHRPESGDHEVIVAATHPALPFFDRGDVERQTGRCVFVDHTDSTAEFDIPHISLAEWAEAVIVYPASANTIAKCAHGFADSLVSNLVLATRSPVYFGPTMNDAMYDNAITQKNLKALEAHGYHIIPQENAKVLVTATGDLREQDAVTQRMVLSVLKELFADR